MKYTEEQVEQLLDFIQDMKSQMDTAEDDYQRKSFKERHPDFEEFTDKLKLLNGDGFDIYNSAYDEWHNDFSDLPEDDYMNALKENIVKKFSEIWPEANEEEVAEAVEDVVEEAEADAEAEAEADTTTDTEAEANAEADVETETEANSEEAKDNEMEEFQRDLDEEYEKEKRFKRD